MATAETSPVINVHPVEDPARVIEARALIAQALIGQRGTAAGDAGLQVSELSGALYYVDDDALWNNTRGGGLPSDEDAAKRAATDWVTMSRKRLSARPPAGLSPTAILPEGLQASSASPVFAPDADLPDHWLVSFAIDLPTGLGAPYDRASTDAAFDIRLGASGSIIGISTSWRPLVGQPETEALVSSPPGSPPMLVYLVGSSDHPLTKVSPYYVEASGDGGMLWPASMSTLLVLLTPTSDGESTSVKATVLRGVDIVSPDELTLSWGAWRVDQPVSEMIELGSGESVPLPGAGVYNVVVDVQDERGGRLERAQLIVFAGSSPQGTG